MLSNPFNIRFFFLLVFPLIVGEYDRLLYPIGHDVFSWIGIEIIAVSFLVLAIFKRGTAILPRFSWIIALFFLWWIVTGLATLFSPQIYLSFWGSLERTDGFFTFSHFAALFFIACALFRTKKAWHALFSFISLSSALATSIALWEKFDPQTSRVFSTFGNTNFFAGYLLLVIFTTLSLFVPEKRRAWKLGFAAAFLLETTALIFTFSRAAYIGVFAGSLVFLILLPRASQKFKVATIMGLAAIILSAGIIQISGHGEFVKKISPNIYDRFLSPFSTNALVYRLEAWQAGARSIRDRPLFGWGPENFLIAYHANYKGVQNNKSFAGMWFDRAHNILVEIAVTSGIAGLITFLAFYISLIAKNVRVVYSSASYGTRLLCAGAAATFIASFINNLFNFYTPAAFLYFTVLAAWTASVPRQKTQTAKTLPQSASLPNSAVAAGGAVLALLLILFALGRVHIPVLLANYNLNQGTFIFKQNPSRAFQYLENGLRRDAPMITPYIRTRYAEFLLEHAEREKLLAHPEQARAELAKGLALIEKNINGEFPLSLEDYIDGAMIASSLYEFNKDYKEKADAFWDRAIELSPSFPAILLMRAESDARMETLK